MIEQLQESPQKFSFFQAIRLLQLHYHRVADGASIRRAVGYDHAPSQEIARFHGHPSLAFPPNEIADFGSLPAEDADPPENPVDVTVNFLGLYGAIGVLPTHYTQTIIDESKSRRGTPTRDFFDLFNHRCVSLFYRAWEKYRLPILFERTHTAPLQRADAITECVYALIGMAPNGTRNRRLVPDSVFLFYSGAFSSYPRNAKTLQRVLIEFFQLPFRLIQFQGEWLQLAPDQCTQLSPGSVRQSANNRLGVDALAGTRVWNVDGLIRVRVGPVNYERFTQLMPGKTLLVQIAQFVRQYVGIVLECEYQIVLRRDDVPQLQMRGGTGGPGPCLGLNTWLLSAKSATDRDDAVFRCAGMPTR